ncbi:MAG: HAMP domain-containing sensor histidine kinase [Acidimicrobiia bacterium]
MAQFVIPPALPTAILLLLGVASVVLSPDVRVEVSATALAKLGAIAATLAFMTGVASLLRWRLDGIARGWWCGWAFVVIGTGYLFLGSLNPANIAGAELAAVVLAMLLVARSVFGPAVDATIRLGTTITQIALGLAIALVPAVAVGHSPERVRVALAITGGLWMLLALAAAARQHRGHHDAGGSWIIPVAVAFGLAELIPISIGHAPTGAVADRVFELAATGLASVGALGGLVGAAVHHRTRALREQVERERESANHRRVEESFADRLHEMRSTMVAIEGGVATWGPTENDATPESTLRAALIAEIRRLRTLVNESPSATGVEVFDVEMTLAPTIALHRASGQHVTFRSDGITRAVARPAEIAQVVEGLLTNAAKYAPGVEVRVVARHELDEVSIRVEDDGPGIDPLYWDRVFDRGFRVDPDSPTGDDGIGLSVARRLVRSQDGDLWVEAAASGGAAFVMSVPAAPALRIVPTRAEGLRMTDGTSTRTAEAR